MECKRCGSTQINIFRHDVVSVGTDVVGGEYAACEMCGLHADLDDLLDEFAQEEYMPDWADPDIEEI